MFASFLDPYPKINNGNVSLESVYKDKSNSNSKRQHHRQKGKDKGKK